MLHLNLYMRLHLGSNICFNARLSVCTFLTRERSTGIYSCLSPLLPKPLKLEQHHDLPPPPQSACLECCSACSECCSACCSPTRPKTVWTPSKFCFRDIKAGRVRITNTEWQMQCCSADGHPALFELNYRVREVGVIM